MSTITQLWRERRAVNEAIGRWGKYQRAAGDRQEYCCCRFRLCKAVSRVGHVWRSRRCFFLLVLPRACWELLAYFERGILCAVVDQDRFCFLW